MTRVSIFGALVGALVGVIVGAAGGSLILVAVAALAVGLLIGFAG